MEDSRWVSAQVYYVGLLAGTNDEESIRLSGEGREINRHNYDLEEIAQNLNREVVQRLLKLIRFRNEHPAFDGEFEVVKTSDDQLALKWQLDHLQCKLRVDLQTNETTVEFTEEKTAKMMLYRV